jgi:ferritin
MQNSHIYLATSLWLDQQLLKGLAAWFKKQSGEETGHATRSIDYVLDSNESPKLMGLDAPKNSYGSVLDAVKAAHALERKTTAMINDLCNLAAKEGDLATVEAMQWFIKEQVEEEKWTEEFLLMATKIGDHVGSMFMWDHRVSKLAEGGGD